MNSSTCNFNFDKTYKIGEYSNIKTFTCKERVIDDLVLTREDDILNITEAPPIVDAKDQDWS